MTAEKDKSFLSPDLKITGEIRSAGDIEVNGTIEGEITCRYLKIGSEAAFNGKAVADKVEVFGALTGEIRAESVALEKTAKVEGDILHHSLSVEPGARLEGRAQRIGSGEAQNEAKAPKNDRSVAGGSRRP